MLSRRSLFALLALAALACGVEEYARPPPLDRFTFPTGLALHRLPSGTNALLVVSTNIDLLYDAEAGGTVISLDPSADPPRRLGAAVIPSFGGAIAVADEERCPGLGAARALVGSRYSGTVSGLEVGAVGELTCGPGCALEVPGSVLDPFGVATACLGDRRYAYFGYLGLSAGLGAVAEVDLDTGESIELRTTAAPYAMAHEPERDRLWITGVAWQQAPIQYVELGIPCVVGERGCYETQRYDLYPRLPGAEVRGLALSTPLPGVGRRAYVAVRFYDPDLAASLGARPSYDVSAALLVLDIEDGPLGRPPDPIPILNVVPIGLGASEVRVLARPGLRDLVVVTSTVEGLVTLYDDEIGAVSKVFALAQTMDPAENPGGMPLGTPLVGQQPFGLAVESRGGLEWIYVSAFGSSVVTAITVDPADPSGAKIAWVLREVRP